MVLVQYIRASGGGSLAESWFWGFGMVPMDTGSVQQPWREGADVRIMVNQGRAFWWRDPKGLEVSRGH